MTTRTERIRRSPVRGMLTVTSAVLGATLVAAGTAGGTYGLWADASTVETGVVTTGDLAIVTGSSTINPSAWTGLFPGDRVQQSTTLSNTGDVAADVTVQVSGTGAAASSYEVRVAKGSCPSPSAALTTSNSLAATPTMLGIWTAGETSTVCIEVTLRANADAESQGVPVPFTFTFGATQRAA